MSDQLNAEASEQTDFIIETQEAEHSQTFTEDSAPSTDQEQELKPEISPEAQKIIAEKAFNEREAKRKADDLQRQVDDLKAANAPKPPESVAMPDRWDYESDADYQLAVDSYADNRAQVLAYNSQQQQEQQAQQQRAQQAQMEQQRALQDKAASYSGRAKDLGVSAEELQAAGNVINNYGINNDVVMAIVEDPEGPLITKYLSANPQAIDELNNSTWLNGQEVYKKIKSAASALKPKASNAPAPADILQNGAPAEDNNPWGAKFE